MRSVRIKNTSALVAIAITSIVITGCPGRLESPERFTGAQSPSDGGTRDDDDGGADAIDVPAMFAAKCAGGGCHGDVSPAYGLDLVSPGVEDRVRTAGTTACMDRPLVDPADPDSSLLLEKVRDAMPSCGVRMPLVGASLTEPELAALRAWIAAL